MKSCPNIIHLIFVSLHLFLSPSSSRYCLSHTHTHTLEHMEISRQGFSVQSWLSWNSLCRPGWSRTQKSACLCLPSAGITGMRHHCLAVILFLIIPINTARKAAMGGWRGGSAIKTEPPSRGHEFNSQQPHGGSQPSVMRSDALFWCV
jgi:hypothetical protein